MFQGWGFLLGEMWGLLLLAALLGLLAGWLIWGRRSAAVVNTAEADGLRASLEACNAKGRDQAARMAALEGELKAANAKAHDAHISAENARADAKAASEAAQRTAATPLAAATPAAASLMAAPLMASPVAAKAAAPKAAAPKAKPATKPAIKPVAKTAAAAKAEPKTKAAPKVDPKTPAKPKGLTKARGDKADDLKLIKGVGPVLEKLLHKLGYFHFDQIAAWTVGEVAWVDDNLEGFKGRVTREEWVVQARDLMNGLPPRAGGEK